ncbi:hypothetical protein FQN58_14705 [Bacteroides xylanisolvens]|uniref:hypothetical protein n=1 Tax=Bacteroides xylanisolvens TaxID=371601 RepID=UPI001BA6608E|nr:hypothetical protein [Bacteroides xylanisolvens]QUR44366.1 hypothetical protein FQN58_14705 [Bacteroides xylanisolvens]
MDKKLMNLLGVWLFAVASVCALTACSDNDTENPEGEKNGGENGKPTPETVEFINSNLVYWGDEDGVGTDHFVLTLYTDMEVDAAGNPIGPGKIMAFSLNVPPFASGTTEFPLPEGTFDAAPNGYTFNEWTFNLGYMNQMDLPTGKVEVPAGSFYGDVKAHSTSVDADLLSGGKMTVKRSADGEYTISGVLVGDLSLKRYFTYTGKLTTIDRHGSTEEIPNSTLNADLTLNEWAQARLQDKGDFYYLQDESCRVLELYLAEEGVGLAETWPTGNGRVLKVEFFVEWATDVTQGIPAGTYKVVARDEESKGILREFLKPGGIASGYPNVFTYPAGTWYEKISNGTMKEYARIDAGTMTVVRDGDKHTLTIDFIDCDKAHPHHVRSTFSQDTPINVFGYHP